MTIIWCSCVYVHYIVFVWCSCGVCVYMVFMCRWWLPQSPVEIPPPPLPRLSRDLSQLQTFRLSEVGRKIANMFVNMYIEM